MNVVIFNLDLHPITVIDLPIDQYSKTLQIGGIVLALPNGRTCRIRAVQIDLDGLGSGHIFVTPDEESALTIANSYLPGQRKDVNLALGLIHKLKNKLENGDQ